MLPALLLAALGLLSGMACAMPANQIVNQPGQDATTQDTQNEPTIVLGTGGSIVVAFVDSGSMVGGAHKGTGYSVAIDGLNFIDRGTLPDSPGGDAGDPSLARDPTTGVVYLSVLPLDDTTTIRVFRSNDGGSTFTPAVDSAPGFGGGDLLDKPWLAVDGFPGPRGGTLYQVFRNLNASDPPNNGILVTRSSDGGTTWGPSHGVLVTAGGQGALPVVGPDHALHVLWYQESVPAQIVVRTSTDGGTTFAAPVPVATLNAVGVNGNLGLGGGFVTNAFPAAAVNPVTGELYVVFNDHNGADRGDVFFSRSTDGGATWSPRVVLNDDAGTNDQWMPSIAVTPDGRALAVAWYDRRDDPMNSLIDTWGTLATIGGGGVQFRPNFRISDESFPVAIGQDPTFATSNPGYMGDYNAMAADTRLFYYVWGDNRLTHLGLTRHDPDVRLARIPAPGADLALTLRAPATTAQAGSPLAYTITVTNGGPDPATTVSVRDTLPAGVGLVSATATQGTCGAADGAGVVTCDLGPLAPGDVATITLATSLACTVPGDATVHDTAAASTPTSDGNPGNDTASADVAVTATPGCVSGCTSLPTLASIACRLRALASSAGADAKLGRLKPALARLAGQAKDAVARAEAATRKRAERKALARARTVLGKFGRLLRSARARRLIGDPVRTIDLGIGDAVRADLGKLLATLR